LEQGPLEKAVSYVVEYTQLYGVTRPGWFT